MPLTTRTSLLAVCVLLAAGCAALPPGKRDARDPWERMNRATYRFNATFDKAIARPVARGYRKAVPHFAQTGIRHFFDNIDTPIVMLNDLLQGQFRPFLNDSGRLLLNSTIGIGGLLDPATAAGLDKNDRDFGQTLGKWGMGTGPYFVIPFLGPSDARDTVGKVADSYTTPRTYIHNIYWRYGLWLTEKIDTRSRLLDTDRLLDGAYDPYAFLRNAYLQHRAFKVHGGETPNEEEQEQKMLEEAGEEPAEGTAPPQTSPPH